MTARRGFWSPAGRSAGAEGSRAIAVERLILRRTGADDEKISRAAKALRDGLLVAFPTETVYGLGANADNPDAVERLYAAKGRDRSKPCAMLIPDRATAERLAGPLPRVAAKLMRIYWPGPLTVVVSASRGPAVGLRLPADPTARALVSRAGVPVLAPSANLSGGPEPRSADDVMRQLGSRIDIILDGGPVRGGVPSTVVRVTGDRVEILRAGAIAPDEILDAAAMVVLFVCKGNSCRSPMAEAIFRRELKRRLQETGRAGELGRWKVASAGTDVPSGSSAHENASVVCGEVGLDLSGHLPRSLTMDSIDKADLIFTMDERLSRAILEIVPDAAGRAKILDPGGGEIADPAGGDVASYRLCRDRIAECVRRRVGEI